jgi:hypothetical protein
MRKYSQFTMMLFSSIEFITPIVNESSCNFLMWFDGCIARFGLMGRLNGGVKDAGSKAKNF